MQRATEGIGLIAAALLPPEASARPIALPLAISLLHSLREALRAFAQRFQRLALRINGRVGVALPQAVAGIAHCGVRLAEPVFAIALLIALFALLTLLSLLTLLAPLAALVFLATLPLPHAAFGQLLLQFLQPVAQPLLILLQIAHALIALLAAHAIPPRILALLESLVAQLLLLTDHIAKLV